MQDVIGFCGMMALGSSRRLVVFFFLLFFC